MGDWVEVDLGVSEGESECSSGVSSHKSILYLVPENVLCWENSLDCSSLCFLR